METEFYRTGMGRKYYDSDVPKIGEALESISKSLKEITSILKEVKKESDNDSK